jgi:hypothetical protein
MWVFIAFNVVGAVFLYWLARVPKKPEEQQEPLPVADGKSEGLDSRTLAGVNITASMPTTPAPSVEEYEIPVELSQETVIASEKKSLRDEKQDRIQL